MSRSWSHCGDCGDELFDDVPCWCRGVGEYVDAISYDIDTKKYRPVTVTDEELGWEPIVEEWDEVSHDIDTNTTTKYRTHGYMDKEGLRIHPPEAEWMWRTAAKSPRSNEDAVLPESVKYTITGAVLDFNPEVFKLYFGDRVDATRPEPPYKVNEAGELAELSISRQDFPLDVYRVAETLAKHLGCDVLVTK